MKTADKRGKEKRYLSDYFELTEQTYENHQGSLFKKKKKATLLQTKSKSKQNPKSLQFYFKPQSSLAATILCPVHLMFPVRTPESSRAELI